VFSWIPIYTELAKKVLPFRNRQSELIQLLKELGADGIPAGSTFDKDDKGEKTPLTSIDPFTFYSCFNRGLTKENRCKILAYFKEKLQLQSEVPTDFDGVPVVSNQAAWFFTYQSERKPDDIPSLWTLAESVVAKSPEELDPKLFERCLQILSVGPAKLTMGMFWLNPKYYIACDANNRKVFEQKGINSQVNTLADYVRLIRDVNSKLGTDYPQISSTAVGSALSVGEATGDFVISRQQLQLLWTRFSARITGFEDFDSPGDLTKELDYKRSALKHYEDQVGNNQIREWVDQGQGDKARGELSKRIQANLVAYQSWRPSIGSNNEQSCAVLKAYLDVADKQYAGPSTTEPIFQATLAQGLKLAWDSLAAILWAMRPTEYFPIKISYYRELAEELGHSLPAGPPTSEKLDEVLKFGRAFWTALKAQNPIDWVDVQSFMWVVCPTSYKGDKRDKQYWAGGFLWSDDDSQLERFIKDNVWQIRWSKTDANPAAKKTWDYFEDVNVGDEFAIKGFGGRNDLRVHYIGEVINKNEDGALKLQKLDRLLYKDKGPKGLTGATWFDTLVPIKSQEIIDAIFHGAQPAGEYDKKPKAVGNIPSGVNTILYGPPGTGKTYETIERSVKVIAPSFSGDHAAHKRKFDEMRREGRVEFITFHQSYSYEDFIEGIRPVVDVGDEGGSPRYECRPGAFKRLACNALFDCLETAEAAKQLVPFDVLWKALLFQIESEPETKYPGLSEKTSYQLNVTPKGNLEGINVISDKRFLCSRKILEQVFNAKRSQDSVTVSDVMEVVARGCHSQLVAAVFNELRRVEKSQFVGKVQLQQHTAYSEEEKAEAVQRYLTDGEKSGYQLKPESQWNQYVLVIDEINRGNISKILGELITLIEPDKRLRTGDNQNTLVVTLPYSGERFAVPANLHVLATMNTADKSIALVDVALRRRFDFKELAVDLSVCKQLTGSMRSALQELNRRIVLRKDRDHQIGHAYFVSVTDDASFNQRFRSQIIPLLQEYFYNDWEGLRYILGENSTAEGLFLRKVSGSEAKEARTKWQWFFDAGTDGMNCLEALCGNYQIV
jgi:5-methylcytosine-specific restriction endonuclease McrBC GTP-binding regulatory subunit McrB